MNKKILYFFCFIISQNFFAQCLNTVSASSNKGGYFDSNDLDTYWYYTAPGGGSQSSTFSIDTSDFYYDEVGASAAGALKVVISSSDNYLDNNVRMWTKNSNGCPYTIDGANEDWNVSFYIKGEVGDELEFHLVQNGSEGTSIASNSYKVRYKGWHYMRLKLSPTSSSASAGKLRINFKSPGTLRLDNIVLEKDTSGSSADNFNIWYVGDGTNGSSTANNPSGTFAQPFSSLKNAILNNTNYRSGDLVYVRSGTYKNVSHDGDNDDWPAETNPYTTTNSEGSDDNDPYFQINRYSKYDEDGNGSNGNDSGDLFLTDRNGSVNRPVIIKNYVNDSEVHDTPKILFDGSGGIVLGSGTEGSSANDYSLNYIIQHIEIAGFEIQGPNQNITYTEASRNRKNAIYRRNENASNTSALKNLYHGRGIVVWGGYYVNIHNNTVYDCPNSGIRFNNSDFVRVSYNTVYNNTWWSYNGESGIVIAQSRNRDSDDTATKIKMRIENNITYNNINKLVYYNPSYNCDTSGNYDVNKNSYACGGRDKIVDGSGCYITRNSYDSGDSGGSNPNYDPHGSYIGTFLFANNVSYGNGMNGVVVHKTDYANVYNNTVHKNGEVPSSADSDWVSANNHTYENSEGASSAWKTPLGSGRQNYTGIVVHSSSYVNVYNNISVAKNSNDQAYVNYVESGWSVSNVNFGSGKNIAGNGTTVAGGNQSLNASDFTQSNPQFVDDTNSTLSNRDYTLLNNSPAIDSADSTYAVENDINGISRPQGNGDDMGAYESLNTWTGSANTSWTNTNNWSAGIVPVSGRSPVISNTANDPIISSTVTLKDITVESSASLTIDSSGVLNINGTLKNSGDITVQGTLNVE